MASIKVVAGDIARGTWKIEMFTAATMGRPGQDSIDLTIADDVQQLTEQNVKKLTGTALWGAAGAALLGPIGAIGGMLIGGNKKEIAFVVTLRGGKRFMAKTDGKTFEKIIAARFV